MTKIKKGKTEMRNRQEGKLLDNNSSLLNTNMTMKAIHSNGFETELNGHWINFSVKGELYYVNTEYLPILIMMEQYDIDSKEWNLSLVRQAAQQVSDDMVMVKVFLLDKSDYTITFQIASIENKYEHLNDCLTNYIDILRESKIRFITTYCELEQREILADRTLIESNRKEEGKMVVS